MFGLSMASIDSLFPEESESLYLSAWKSMNALELYFFVVRLHFYLIVWNCVKYLFYLCVEIFVIRRRIIRYQNRRSNIVVS